MKNQKQAASARQVFQASNVAVLIRQREIRDSFAGVGTRSVTVIGGLYVAIAYFGGNGQTCITQPPELPHCRCFFFEIAKRI